MSVTYWLHQRNHGLDLAVWAFVHNIEMTPAQLKLLREYIVSWYSEVPWQDETGGEEVARLKEEAKAADTAGKLRAVIERGIRLGIDPL